MGNSGFSGFCTLDLNAVGNSINVHVLNIVSFTNGAICYDCGGDRFTKLLPCTGLAIIICYYYHYWLVLILFSLTAFRSNYDPQRLNQRSVVLELAIVFGSS